MLNFLYNICYHNGCLHEVQQVLQHPDREHAKKAGAGLQKHTRAPGLDLTIELNLLNDKSSGHCSWMCIAAEKVASLCRWGCELIGNSFRSNYIALENDIRGTRIGI